jgi:hypothetical protein
LLRPAQLKKVLWNLEGLCLPPQGMLPLESAGVFAGKRKIMSGPGKTLRYWSSRNVACSVFAKYGILVPEAFDEVAWQVVHSALCSNRVTMTFCVTSPPTTMSLDLWCHALKD